MEYHDGYEDMDDGQEDMPDDQESLNFDDNPEWANLPKLDKMRKIRRDILKTINDLREKNEVPGLYIDSFANKSANDYANYCLSNEENDEYLKGSCTEFHVQGVPKALIGLAYLEEEEDHQGTLPDNLMDAHGLLLELQEDMTHLINPQYTHIGIGFAFDKTQVRVVEILTTKHMMVN